MPSKGTRSKDVSPVPSSEPRAPTHKSSHTSRHHSHSKTSKKSDTKSRPSKTGAKEAGGSKAASGPKKEGSKKEGSKKEGSAAARSGHAGSKRSHDHDIEAPPSRDDNTASESIKERGGSIEWSLFPYALLGFIFGLLLGALLVLFVGFCFCIFSDWRRIWEDKPKRAFLGGFAAGVLIAIIIYVVLFIALAVD